MGWFLAGMAVLAAAGMDPAPRDTLILVMPVQAKSGVSSDSAALCTQLLISELRKTPGTRIISSTSVADALTLEQQRQLLDCDSDSCATELAGALRADQFVSGSLGRLGDRMVLALSLVDARTASTVGATTQTWQGVDEGTLVEVLPPMVRELMSHGPTRAVPPPTKVAADNADGFGPATPMPPLRHAPTAKAEPPAAPKPAPKPATKRRAPRRLAEEQPATPAPQPEPVSEEPAAWRTPGSRVMLGTGTACAALSAVGCVTAVFGPIAAVSMFPVLALSENALAGSGAGQLISVAYNSLWIAGGVGLGAALLGLPPGLVLLVAAWLVAP